MGSIRPVCDAAPERTPAHRSYSSPPNGESVIAILSGANASLTPDDITSNERLFDNAGYCLIQTEIPLESAKVTAITARRHHAKTIIKPSSCDYLPDSIVANADILVPNEHELAIIETEGKTMEDKAAHLLERGAGCVIVTQGEHGCYLRGQNVECHYPAADFTPVDSTGAGDAFISALASYLMYGYTVRQAVEIATYAAGYSITRKGVIPSLIDRLSLDAYVHHSEQ